MSSKIANLNDLLIVQLKDLYSAESQLTRALPKMAKAAHSTELQDAFLNHLDETKEQISRLEQIATLLDMKLQGHKCVAMEGLIAEGEETIKEDMDPEVLDAALICAAQRVEHYEMAGYGCARTFAETLGFADVAQLLADTLEEEAAADQTLTNIAISQVNLAAAH
ncbi:MAG: ferritin-like domain-containing protein [Planctomycetaceae bacterium]|nr:ferritin-like domain-containing protein [Planctomycetaceae bacterium]